MRLGRYELLYRLAKGGMGEVFLARRKGPGDIEKRVVIKRIRRDLSGDPRFVDMFLREAKVSMTLSHKNIAAVFDFGRAGQELFLAMEHVDGRDLARAQRAAVLAEKRLSETAAAYIGIEVCRALTYAHKAGSDGEPIIHRDLSLKNLLISFSGEVVVADFGLAIESADQATGAVRGTPAYLSPEQARGEALDGRSDLFSLGIVLRELVTGESAYSAESPRQIIELASGAELEPLASSVAPLLRAVIEKATAPEPDDRFDDAWSMQQALDQFLVAERAAGAAAPGNEIATWLSSLFDRDQQPKQASDVGELAAVTFLEDGEDAVSRDARARTGSLAETIGDSELEQPEESDARANAERPSRRGLALILVLATMAAAAGVVFVATRNDGAVTRIDAGELLVLDAASAPIDAKAPDAAADAAIDAAPDAAIDAAAKRVEGTGFVRIQSRPWARVTIRGSGGCAETPCRIKLSAGRHTVTLVNPVTGARATRKIVVKAGATTDLSVSLPKP